MNRREFLAALAVAASLPSNATPAASTSPKVTFRIDEATDDFACEKSASIVEHHLGRLLETGTLPMAPEFHGSSPLPSGYHSVAENVEQADFQASDVPFQEGLKRWIASLGTVRTADFFALPADQVRYEIASANEYRVGLWKQVWRDGKLHEFAPLEETLVKAPTPFFRDVTGHCLGDTPSFRDQLLKGNTWWRARLDAATGIDVYGNNGIAAGDIDNDGADEIYVCQPGGLPNRLYKIRPGGRMEDITEASGLGVLDDTSCALFADFRNSGAQDLVVLRGAGPLYFQNDGHGVFTHQPDAFRFRTPPQGSFTGMAAADYDRDGRVDLYLCCYVYFQSEDQYRYPVPYHDAQNGPPNFLFRNVPAADGALLFDDVTEAAGLNHNNNRYSFAPAWCDLAGDGYPSLYVANDFGRNNLYRNRAGKFRDEAAQAGVEDMGPGMSATWVDYDGDGRPDLYISNMWSAPGQRIVHDPTFAPSKDLPEQYRRHTKGNSLYRNRGDGTFEETGAREGVEMGRWAWSSDALDFDNDGSPEIYGTAGMLSHPHSTRDLSSFFWRQVVAKSPASAQPAPEYENGWNAINQLIREDYGWCGHEANVFFRRPQPAPGHPARFYDFSGVSGLDFADDSRAFAALDLEGDGNLDLILKSRQGPQVRVLQNDCGASKPVIVLKLRGTQSNRDAIGARVEVNGRVQFVKAGSGYLSQHTKQLHFATGTADPAAVQVTWPSGLKQKFEAMRPGFRYQIVEGSGTPAGAPLKPRAVYPSVGVVPENTPTLADTWLLEPVPLPGPKRPAGLLLLTAADMGNTGEPYAIFRRYLFEYRTGHDLPLALLIDGENRARKLYAGQPSAATLRADAQSPANALPFPGRYYLQPHRNYFKLAAAFYGAGYPEQALPYLDEVMRRNPANWKALNAIARIQLDAGRAQPSLDAYTRVLELKPGYGPALAGAGEAYASMNRAAPAEAMFKRALEVNANDSDAANQLGVLYAKQDRLDDARRWFQRAISAQKDHSGAINNLAVLYVKLGQPNDAIAAFQYGIDQAPSDKTLYMNLGRLYTQTGDLEKARQVMRRLLAQIPNDPTALKALQELESR